jgi:CRP-like cAMP-binding protein
VRSVFFPTFPTRSETTTRPAKRKTNLLHEQSEACASQNGVLSALPTEQLSRILEHCQLVELPAQHLFFEPEDKVDYAYFLCSGMASAATVMRDGRCAEAMSIGREGMCGFPALTDGQRSQFRLFMVAGGTGIKIPGDVIRSEYRAGGALAKVLQDHLRVRLVQMAQLAACNGLHSVEQRLARYLLTASDLLGNNRLPFTHEVLAEMLGAQRTTVTNAALNLERAGAISYKRGQIDLVDKAKLSTIVCECYEMLNSHYHKLNEKQDCAEKMSRMLQKN